MSGRHWSAGVKEIILTMVLACGVGLAQGAAPLPEEGLMAFWDFPEGKGMLVDRVNEYVLEEKNGGIRVSEKGVFPGSVALDFSDKQWLMVPREKCPALNLTGDSEVTVMAWVRRMDGTTWQFIAGMWDEKNSLRQYGLFTCGTSATDWRTMKRSPVENRVHGYISEVGGATPGKPFCFSYATGATELPRNEWVMAAYTFDGKELRVYFNGELDGNGNSNPLPWPEKIFDPGEEGSDFTVGARAIPKWEGYPEQEVPVKGDGFTGMLGGLAVYGRALGAEEIRAVWAGTLGGKR